MKEKLKKLVETSTIKFWNGSQIKRCSFGDWDMKQFRVDKKKYKFGIEISQKCNNETKFTPVLYEFRLLDYKTGMSYLSIDNISNFLNISVLELEEILKPMIEKSTFNQEEIDKSIQEYRDFVLGFRKDFVGLDDSEYVVKYIKTIDIKNLI
jgi:hypothetical protein